MALWYQVVSRVDYGLEYIVAFVLIFVFLQLQLYVKESPRWYLNIGKYKKARKVLTEVAVFNGVEKAVYRNKVCKKMF